MCSNVMDWDGFTFDDDIHFFFLNKHTFIIAWYGLNDTN